MKIINQYIVNGERTPINTKKVHGIATGGKRILIEAEYLGESLFYILQSGTPIEVKTETALGLIATATPFFKSELVIEN